MFGDKGLKLKVQNDLRMEKERYSKTEATFTLDRTGTVSNRTGPDRLLFTWNRLEPIQVFT